MEIRSLVWVGVCRELNVLGLARRVSAVRCSVGLRFVDYGLWSEG
ncbi:hypothetical protein M2390_002322 [Mycetocola sp. BIGb0189]|nr:hypothetical protein [Mycetocola sp. BIGb0189]